MVALQRVADGEEFVQTSPSESLLHDAATGLRFRCKVAFVDLDLKCVASMPHYVALDRSVRTSFANAARGAC